MTENSVIVEVGTGADAGFDVGAEVEDVIGVVVGPIVEEGGHGVHVVQSPQPRHT